jgi:transposase
MMKILAINLGKYNSMCCFCETKTQEYRFQTVATTREYLTTVFKNHEIDLVVMEACGPSGWICDLCQELGRKTFVCSTNDAAWEWKKVKRETDKDDALKLARLAIMRQLTRVHVPKHEVREHRSLIKYRKKLVGRINKIKSTIRGLFVCQGVEIAKGQPAWYSGRELINSHRKPLAECSVKELWRSQLDLVLTQLYALSQQIAVAENAWK